MRAALGLTVMTACSATAGPPGSVPLAWEVVLAGGSGQRLVATPAGFCFYEPVPTMASPPSLRCHDRGGALAWRRDGALVDEPVLAVDAAGDVLAAGQRSDDWYVEKRDGLTGASRWTYVFRPAGVRPRVRVLDLTSTPSGDVVLAIRTDGSHRDLLDGDGDGEAGFNFLVRLAGADGSRRWRHRLGDGDQFRIATDGEDTVVVATDRVERRAAGGDVIATTPVAGPIFVNRVRSDDVSPEALVPAGGFFTGAGGALYGTPRSPGFLLVTGADATPRSLHALAGAGSIAELDMMPGPDSVVLGGMFEGNIQIGDSQLQGDARRPPPDERTPPWPETYGSMPFIAKLTRDGEPLWARSVEPDWQAQSILDVAVNDRGEVLVLRQVIDEPGQLRVSAFGP